jgi:hypothetical protein
MVDMADHDDVEALGVFGGHWEGRIKG